MPVVGPKESAEAVKNFCTTLKKFAVHSTSTSVGGWMIINYGVMSNLTETYSKKLDKIGFSSCR